MKLKGLRDYLKHKTLRSGPFFPFFPFFPAETPTQQTFQTHYIVEFNPTMHRRIALIT